MNRKRSFLTWWCGTPWLITTYVLGFIMLVILVLNWGVWSVPQKIMALLAVFLPLHVFEELTWPDGFYFMMNKIFQKSDNPLAYPENRLTDMITNLGAEILFIALTFLTPYLGNKPVVFAIFFCLGETLVHTIFSVLVYKTYRSKGKRTLYSPGFATAWGLLLGTGLYSIYWLLNSGTFTSDDLWGLAIVAFLIIFLIRLPFIFSNRFKSTRYSYDDPGYFKKYED